MVLRQQMATFSSKLVFFCSRSVSLSFSFSTDKIAVFTNVNLDFPFVIF